MPHNNMVTPQSAGTLSYTRQLDSMESVCFAPGECLQADPLSPAFILLSTGLLTILLAVTLVKLRKAHSILAEERKRTESERDAFAAFARRIATIDTSPTPSTMPAAGGVTPLAASGSDQRLDEVRDHYRETVMGVAHYKEEYDETLEQNMTGEFGEDIAVAVSEGSMLTPQLQQALVNQSRVARDRRDRFLDRLDTEADELTTAEETANRIVTTIQTLNETRLSDRSYAELQDLWEQLRRLQYEVESLLEDRQHMLQRHGDPAEPDRTIQPYLYRSLDVTYPILDSGASIIGELRKARHRVLHHLTSRG